MCSKSSTLCSLWLEDFMLASARLLRALVLKWLQRYGTSFLASLSNTYSHQDLYTCGSLSRVPCGARNLWHVEIEGFP